MVSVMVLVVFMVNGGVKVQVNFMVKIMVRVKFMER